MRASFCEWLASPGAVPEGGHRRFSRSYMRPRTLLAVGGHCLQRGAGLHGRATGVGGSEECAKLAGCSGSLPTEVGGRTVVDRWELVLR